MSNPPLYPQTLFCHFCGSKIGTNSLLEHEKLCFKKLNSEKSINLRELSAAKINSLSGTSYKSSGPNYKSSGPSYKSSVPSYKLSRPSNKSSGPKPSNKLESKRSVQVFYPDSIEHPGTSFMQKLPVGLESKAEFNSVENFRNDVYMTKNPSNTMSRFKSGISKNPEPRASIKHHLPNEKCRHVENKMDVIHCNNCRGNISRKVFSQHKIRCSKVSREKVPQRKSQYTNPNPRVQGISSRFQTCILCGRPFGKASIGIHEPKCLEKWRIQNNNLPKHLQRPEPRLPDRNRHSKRPRSFSIRKSPTPSCLENENFNAKDQSSWEQHLTTLVPCPHCERTFFPSRIQIHESICAAIKRKKKRRVFHIKYTVQ